MSFRVRSTRVSSILSGRKETGSTQFSMGRTHSVFRHGDSLLASFAWLASQLSRPLRVFIRQMRRSRRCSIPRRTRGTGIGDQLKSGFSATGTNPLAAVNNTVASHQALNQTMATDISGPSTMGQTRATDISGASTLNQTRATDISAETTIRRTTSKKRPPSVSKDGL